MAVSSLQLNEKKGKPKNKNLTAGQAQKDILLAPFLFNRARH